MNQDDWTLLSVAIEGEALEIDGADVWHHEWRRLDIGILEVPHPSYPQQRHKLWPYVIEAPAGTVLFCAGELSNGVWCFYTPARGQAGTIFKGMTINERLVAAGLSTDFDRAVAARNKRLAEDLLIATGLSVRQASETVASLFKNPDAYGFAADED